MGMSRDKTIIGVAFYGRSFRLASPKDSCLGANLADPMTFDENTGQYRGNYTLERGYVAYFEICSAIQSNPTGWREHWDSYGRVPFVVNDSDWIGYENAESIRAKMTWIKAHGFGGGMLWAIDLDDYRGSCTARKHTLLRVMEEELRPNNPKTYCNE